MGAGAGSYEPPDLELTAVEPSERMRAQRPPGAAPVVDAHAEDLPFADGSFDAAMAILSDHHWPDHERGLAELRRVARRRVVLFNWDPAAQADSWLVRDYLRGFERLVPPGYAIEQTLERLGGGRIEPVPVPHDCRDGFLHAYWRRPRAYLDPRCEPASRPSTCCPPQRSPRPSSGCAATSTAASGSGATRRCSASTSSTSATAWS